MDTKIVLVGGVVIAGYIVYQLYKKRITALQTQKSQLQQQLVNMEVDPSLGNNQYYVNQTKRQRIISETAQRVIEMSNTHVDRIKTEYDLDLFTQRVQNDCEAQVIYDSLNNLITNTYINSLDNEPGEVAAAAAYMRKVGLMPIKSVFLDQVIPC